MFQIYFKSSYLSTVYAGECLKYHIICSTGFVVSSPCLKFINLIFLESVQVNDLSTLYFISQELNILKGLKNRTLLTSTLEGGCWQSSCSTCLVLLAHTPNTCCCFQALEDFACLISVEYTQLYL